MSLAAMDGTPAIDVTVTFLEMDRQPAYYPPRPVGKQIVLLRARTLQRSYYRYLMDRVGRDWHWVNVLRLDDTALDQRLGDPTREISVLYLDGAPAGFFEITAMQDIRELTFFGLMAHAMGQGIGRWFLGTAVASAWAPGPRSVTVQTCTLDHPAALSLYQKLGFRPVGQQRETVTPMTLEERAAVLARD